ncbi:hypothetical protein [Sulfurirhabdus autotrophica]|uniref:Uncharacterized protein n=1 Tax=Sulfurirhabdus autotrophica TaxID=1706046 RepID=A0A4R3XUM2_9PROT|nr:hypothetical protein [Sulfurirhabdus autotrophica]TCV81074.1 hypothetical protein EDC63_12732 [Sulfurirhabdus autotrophica]
MMTDEEFNELLNRLFQLGSNDGDLGAEYWNKVIRQLKEMRVLAQVQAYEEAKMAALDESLSKD